MKTPIPLPQLIAHEILIFGVIFFNAWALSMFSLAAGIGFPSPSILAILYVARICIGAYRYLSDHSFTFSSKRVYPPLFTTSILFLAISYLFLYFPTINGVIGFPISISPLFMLLIAIGVSWFFIHRQKLIIKRAEQDAAANP
jgi:hypothetical protein